jgi:hypothetical protein
VASAAAGFKRQKQFFMALHVARNLDIPFNDLKAAMMNNDSLSLKVAIPKLRPGIEGKVVADNVSLAERQTARDLDRAWAASKRPKRAIGFLSTEAR